MQNSNAQWTRAGGLLLGAILFTGCATDRGPVAEIAVSKAAVTDAVAAGGNQYAPIETASARDKVVRAEVAMSNRDYTEARELANQAQADAKLAETKANAAKAQKTADVVKEDTRILHEELQRNSK